ncbi:hypothetical protein [Kosakonia sp. LAM2021]|uniref:hypothetical protein n=1 Tax=Kosakonia sp. LAM2021 TaxID=2800475 RepID=UPI00190C2DE0|nr:hypothetical protein [Kosakonia sp. LAM2021]
MSDKAKSNLPQVAAQEGEWLSGSQSAGGGGGGSYLDGFKDGLAVGVQSGFNEAVNQFNDILPQLIQQELMKLPHLKSALSDGLRHGSPNCGRALVNIYRYEKSNYPKLN